jgi:Ran GTPase-activating protein (RanGAP) involved in mRNA processing and transport
MFRTIINWGEFGASIGRNTFIEEVDIILNQWDLSSFAPGFASNRSIKSLTIFCEALDNGEALGALLPFFMNNSAIKTLRIMRAESTCLHVLASVLRQFDTLTEFTLYDHEHHDDDDDFDEYGELIEGLNDSEDFSVALSEIFYALASHFSLTKLSIEQSVFEGWQYRQILRNGWESLTALLSKSSSNLMVLELDDTPMDNEGASILAAGQLVNASLKEFSLNSTQQMTENGWDGIFDALKRSACTLEKLSICMNQRMEDDVILSLSNALLDNCTLKSLSLWGDDAATIRGDVEYIPSPTVDSCWDLIQLLHNPLCALEILDLTGVRLNNDSMMCLRNALAINSRLRELQLISNHNVTTDGWVNFLTFPNNVKLEKLDLGYSENINDQALDIFRIFLTNNRRLKNLRLTHFSNVTTAGWTAYSAVLRNPNSLLEKLFLIPQEGSAEDIAISFADALTNNKRLRELSIRCRIEHFAPFTRVVCDNSSIMSTYNSNHILSKLSLEYDGSRRPLPNDLASLLQINSKNGVSQAARLKIIKTHFSGDSINTKPFTVMELKVLPTAISWMGRDCGISKISDLLFVFVRSMPSVCDTHSRCKKRKHGN